MATIDVDYKNPGTPDAHIRTVEVEADAGDGNPAIVEFQAPWFQSRADAYTGAGNGVTVDAKIPLRTFGLQVSGTDAAATAWDVRLEGSLDGTQWVEILRHTTTDGDGALIPGSQPFPVLYLRTRCASVTLGSATNIVATLLGVS